ncbi:hypothetical protein HDV05_006167 [Chytridiales sp. JEL 0842]|nr:hypothetical protein HDV05_006167 [Chytridiales sp. JEL 0842]
MDFARTSMQLNWIAYFTTSVVWRPKVFCAAPEGVVSFHRQCIPSHDFPIWERLSREPLTQCDVRLEGTIEDDGIGCLHVDFANKNIGGGVLGNGAVQEEIRFCINPELIVSRLFVEEIAENEAIFITGTERYSSYIGYASTFCWKDAYNDTTPSDLKGQLKSEIVAIDALNFSRYSELAQFEERFVQRELNKAFCGFKRSPISCSANPIPIATGNWGCGAFQGDLGLKALIQIMAASAAQRDLLYFTFGNRKFAAELYETVQLLCDARVTIGRSIAA